jgi:hypothetical protein
MKQQIIKRVKDLYYPISDTIPENRIAEINQAQIVGYNQAIGKVIELLELPNTFLML